MKIRFANHNDKENVLSLLDELLLEVNKKMGSLKKHLGNKKRFAMYDEILKRDDIKIFVVEKNGKLVAMAELFIVPILRRGYHQGVIETFVVSENIRGQGIGSALIEEIIKYCKKNNIPVMKLNSGNELAEAHKFYEHHGGKSTEKLFRFDLK